MNASNMLSRQGHRLLQVGVALFLFSSLEGFVIPYVPVPRLGLSVHTLSALQGVILLTLGLVWPRLNLGATTSRIAFWFLIYSTFATLVPYVLAAIWGAGNSIIPLAAGTAHGSAFQEAIISIVLYSAAPPILISLALILWGLHIGVGIRPEHIRGDAASTPRPHTAVLSAARVVNPLVLSLAGTRLLPLYGVIEHHGRRSGKAYRTPVVVRPTSDGFIVPMPWGESTDWYRNVRAAGECVIRWKGRDYPLVQPELIDDPAAVRASFGAFERAMMTRLGIDHCLRLRHRNDTAPLSIETI
jgi:hydroxylaminobenzene mutase